MPKKIDLTGLVFERLTVIERQPKSRWLCKCVCGNMVIANGHHLKTKRVKSCGCWSKDRTTKHGKEGTPTYNTWAHMLTRCNNLAHKQYKNYGGRGITVCQEWHDFRNFYADMGDKPPKMSLDRIDNNKGYYKENCRWATYSQQNRNTRKTVMVEFCGKNRPLSELAEEYGLPRKLVLYRIKKGWPVLDALTKPSRKGKNAARP